MTLGHWDPEPWRKISLSEAHSVQRHWLVVRSLRARDSLANVMIRNRTNEDKHLTTPYGSRPGASCRRTSVYMRAFWLAASVQPPTSHMSDITSSSGIELTIPLCTGLNGKLETAISANDTQGALDILGTLQASDARKKGALDALAKSKLSKTVNRLTKNEKPGVAQAASALVQEWRKALVKKHREWAPAGPS